MANKAIRYRIYPTAQQAEFFAKSFGCCRKIYNLMLADKIAHYNETGEMLKTTPAQYKAAYPYLKEVDSLALANVQLNLQSAYKKFFSEKNVGFPKFKSKKKSKDSYTTNNQKGTVAVLPQGIKLPKAGIVKAKLHRLAPADWNLKSVTISRECDGKYFASVLYEYDDAVISVSRFSDNAVGLDYKSDGLFYSSDGAIGTNHKYFRESSVKLAKEQRKLSRMIELHTVGYKVIGNKRYPIYDKPLSDCKNIQKQKSKIAKIHRKIANQRRDNLHKLSAKIANSYDIVCVETLDMKAISNKGFGNGKATMDNGYGMFLNMLEYKLSDRGKYFVKVDKWFPSSQICNNCRAIHKLALNERTYICECGYTCDRDYNAAKNILFEGLRTLRTSVA